MPEVNLESHYQCLADGSSAAEEAEANLSAAEATAAWGGTGAADGAASSGSEALVKRFSPDGQGGAPGTTGQVGPQESACEDEEIRAVLTCASLFEGKGLIGAIITGLQCAQSIRVLDKCYARGEEGAVR
jgi:hypothetical protein